MAAPVIGFGKVLCERNPHQCSTTFHICNALVMRRSGVQIPEAALSNARRCRERLAGFGRSALVLDGSPRRFL